MSKIIDLLHVPLYGHTTIYLSNPLSMAILTAL